uniref:ISAs1 family transposase n=1 Tax=Streptomyces sp. NBC_00180 TaxID=2903632 RepID=A0AAU1I9T7_9ACTN
MPLVAKPGVPFGCARRRFDHGRGGRLGSLLALCLVAVLGGATSLAAIARFAADTDYGLREQLGLTSSTTNASTPGRLPGPERRRPGRRRGRRLARYATDPVDEDGDTLAGLAVDGTAVRGSRTDGTAVHLLTAALHARQTVIAQHQITAKSNDIPAPAPLLDRIDLRGVVVTADAMHTQLAHAEHVMAAGGRYVLVVNGNQKKLRKQLRRLPWKQNPLQARTTGTGHGRRKVRRLKVCTVRPGLLPARRPGHGGQAPPHPPQDRQGRNEDRPRHHQPPARTGQPDTTRRTRPESLVS